MTDPKAGVTAVADVRSAPYSRHLPHFNREALQDELKLDGIAYVFLGQQLGGRPRDDGLLRNGIADYEQMAKTQDFKEGLGRVVQGTSRHRIALMCSERHPLDCHRCLLVSRGLAKHDVSVSHILPSGLQISQPEIEDELLVVSGKASEDLFAPREERLAAAYRERDRKVAFNVFSTAQASVE